MRIKVTVVSVNEEHPCSAGYHAGDSFIVHADHCVSLENQTIKCLELLHSIHPNLMAIAHGGRLPWERDGKANSACLDPNSRVVVSLEKLDD